MELRDYLRIIRKRAWLIVLAVVLCSGATFVTSKATAPVYEATAKLLVVAKVDPRDGTNSALQGALDILAEDVEDVAVGIKMCWIPRS